MPVRTLLASAALVSALVLVLCGCTTRRSATPVDWTTGETVPYRLLTVDDFAAKTAASLRGNVAHAAEICTHIQPRADYETSGAFVAVMKPDCSFWNRVVGPIGFVGRMTAIVTGLPLVVPVKQPDLYILQHEQLHFAITEVAARQLSARLAELPPSRRTASLIDRVYAITLEHAARRHHELDSDTSGLYSPQTLERWIRVLEAQMLELCGTEAHCRIRVDRGAV